MHKCYIIKSNEKCAHPAGNGLWVLNHQVDTKKDQVGLPTKEYTNDKYLHIPLTEHFAELRVVEIRVLLRQPFALIFRPHHKSVHRPADARLGLRAPGTGSRTRLALGFGFGERVGPRALPHAGHHD